MSQSVSPGTCPSSGCCALCSSATGSTHKHAFARQQILRLRYKNGVGQTMVSLGAGALRERRAQMGPKPQYNGCFEHTDRPEAVKSLWRNGLTQLQKHNYPTTTRLWT